MFRDENGEWFLVCNNENMTLSISRDPVYYEGEFLLSGQELLIYGLLFFKDCWLRTRIS